MRRTETKKMFFYRGASINDVIQQGCHLAFLKLFARKEMICPFGHFWPFLNVDKNSIFQGFVWTNLSKFQTVYEILNFYLVILTKFLKEIWPLFDLFLFFRIWPFKFFWTWQPCHTERFMDLGKLNLLVVV